MKLRLHRILFCVAAMVVVVIVVTHRESFQNYLKQATQSQPILGDDAKVHQADFWSDQGQVIEELAWNSRGGWIPGRVRLYCWTRDNIIIYRLRGPAPPGSHPEVLKSSKGIVNDLKSKPNLNVVDPNADRHMFAAVYSRISNHASTLQLRRFYMSLSSKPDEPLNHKSIHADGLLLRNGMAMGRLPVHPSDYRIRKDKGYIEVMFRTPIDRPIGNIVFYYKENGRTSWVATDRNVEDTTKAGREDSTFWPVFKGP